MGSTKEPEERSEGVDDVVVEEIDSEIDVVSGGESALAPNWHHDFMHVEEIDGESGGEPVVRTGQGRRRLRYRGVGGSWTTWSSRGSTVRSKMGSKMGSTKEPEFRLEGVDDMVVEGIGGEIEGGIEDEIDDGIDEGAGVPVGGCGRRGRRGERRGEPVEPVVRPRWGSVGHLPQTYHLRVLRVAQARPRRGLGPGSVKAVGGGVFVGLANSVQTPYIADFIRAGIGRGGGVWQGGGAGRDGAFLTSNTIAPYIP